MKKFYLELWTTEEGWQELPMLYYSPEKALADAFERNHSTGDCVRVCTLDGLAPNGFECLATFGSLYKDFSAYVYIGSEPHFWGWYSSRKNALAALRKTVYNDVAIFDTKERCYYFFRRKEGGRFKQYMIYCMSTFYSSFSER